MQFGSLTLAEWDEQLATPPSTPSSTPSEASSPSPPPMPPPALTWADRVATGSTGVSSPANLPSLHVQPVPIMPPPSPLPPPLSPPRRRRPIPKRRLRGLVNAGNSCFINVVLQALLACDPFRRLLLQSDSLSGSLHEKFMMLAREMSHAEEDIDAPAEVCPEDPLLPDWFYDVFPSSVPLSMGTNGSQEDAEEFLTFVLNKLHDEVVAGRSNGNMNGHNDSSLSDGLEEIENGRRHEDGEWNEIGRKGKSVEIRGGEFAESGITSIFGGALRSEVKRPRSKPSVTREPFFSLSLDIESGIIRDVEHALKAYFEPEFLEGIDADDGEMRARKQVSLEQMPQVLILHLKRFSHNSITGALNKVGRMMMFPEVLRIPGKLIHSPSSRWGSGTGKAFELTAVVTHIGKELAGGHYTCDVRLEGEDGDTRWISCDDSKIFKTTFQKVCRKQAYLLFYSMIPGE